MPIPTVTSTRPSPTVRERRADLGAVFAVLVAGAALITVLTAFMADPARVDLTVENPTSFDVTVDVRRADGGGRLDLGTVGPDRSKTFSAVIDQGERWLFEFSYGNVDAPPIEVSRDVVTSGAVVVPGFVEELFLDAASSPPTTETGNP